MRGHQRHLLPPSTSLLLMIAALFVLPDGPYSNRPDIDLWPESRDARLYPGHHPVIAHPPCRRWGRYARGGPSARTPRILGDDGGCFASALGSVRRWGGVLEHPEGSHAWATHGLLRPHREGGWRRADAQRGYTCCVAQGHYGHRAQKLTWLYVYGIRKERLPELVWGPFKGGARLDAGFHSAAERKARAGWAKPPSARRLSSRECALTPEPFAALLISIAQACAPVRSVTPQGLTD